MLNALGVLDESEISLNKAITTKDPDGNDVVVLQMSCKIEKSRGIQYRIDVQKPSVLELNKEQVQSMVNEFRAECEALAIQYNVPII